MSPLSFEQAKNHRLYLKRLEDWDLLELDRQVEKMENRGAQRSLDYRMVRRYLAEEHIAAQLENLLEDQD